MSANFCEAVVSESYIYYSRRRCSARAKETVHDPIGRDWHLCGTHARVLRRRIDLRLHAPATWAMPLREAP